VELRYQGARAFDGCPSERPSIHGEVSCGTSDDLAALIQIAQAVQFTVGRVVIKKPTQEYEDVFGKLDDEAMTRFKKRFDSLLSDLRKAKGLDDKEAAALLRKQFGEDFPEILGKMDVALMNVDHLRGGTTF